MPNPIVRLLKIHGYEYEDVKILKINDDQSFNFIDIDVQEYQIKGYDISTVNKKSEVRKPRGWHMKPLFVDTEGNVYYKGVEQPELKGTLPISE